MSMFTQHPFGAPTDDATLQALADLLPLLVSSEDAAIVAFQRLARDDAFDRAGAMALAAIEAQEREHFALVDGLSQHLPPAAQARAARHAARRFHGAIAAPDAAGALAVVASIDAGICMILSRLLRSGGGVSRVPRAAAILTRIHQEEAGHVAVSRRLALASPGATAEGAGALFSRACQARSELAKLVLHFGHGLEALGVDTDRLVRDLGRVPPGLLS